MKLAGSSSAGDSANAALLAWQSTSEQNVSDSCFAMTLFVQLVYIPTAFTASATAAQPESVALTAVQHFQKYTATCKAANLAVQLHITVEHKGAGDGAHLLCSCLSSSFSYKITVSLMCCCTLPAARCHIPAVNTSVTYS